MSNPPTASRCSFRIITRGGAFRLGGLFATLAVGVPGLLWYMMSIPGESWRGPPPALTEREISLAERLERHVIMLAATIGERNVFRPERLVLAERWLRDELERMGYEVQSQEYAVSLPEYHVRDVRSVNLIAERAGSDRSDEIIIIGAHYDSVYGSPGANDNASGVAALLELARLFSDFKPRRTLRFVFFANEEPPMFQTERMGSVVYARECRARKENIVGMISLETIGYYDESPQSQQYPAPFASFYPDTGNFIGFVANVRSRAFLHEVVGTFREHAHIPTEGGALFGGIPGVGWSDHWAFWQEGYPGLMITDTAPFRYPHYHQLTDTPDKLDYERMARVVAALEPVTARIASPE